VLSRDAFVRLIGGRSRAPKGDGLMPVYLRGQAEREFGASYPLPMARLSFPLGGGFDPFDPDHRAAMLDREF